MRTPTMHKRNADVISMYSRGMSLRQIAKEFDISMQRVHQIMKRYCPKILRDSRREHFHGRRKVAS